MYLLYKYMSYRDGFRGSHPAQSWAGFLLLHHRSLFREKARLRCWQKNVRASCVRFFAFRLPTTFSRFRAETTKNPPAPLSLLFRKRLRARRLFTCKRAHDAPAGYQLFVIVSKASVIKIAKTYFCLANKLCSESFI